MSWKLEMFFFDDDIHVPSIDITGTFLVRFLEKIAYS